MLPLLLTLSMLLLALLLPLPIKSFRRESRACCHRYAPRW
jgi:hypothetical protein